jgi:hypothetical protein
VAIEVRRKGGAAGARSRVRLVVVTATDPGQAGGGRIERGDDRAVALDRFSIASIGDFFRGGLRQTAVRTTASITFEYRPGTQPINPRLLAEEDRKLETMEKKAIATTRLGTGMPLRPPSILRLTGARSQIR